MRAAFWAADDYGCGYYRCEEPARVLAEQGHSIDLGTSLPYDTLHEDIPLVGQRVAKARPSAIWQARYDMGLPNVFELDDDLFSLPAGHKAIPFWHEPQVADRLRTNVRSSDLVITTTEHLAEQVARFNKQVRIIPNFIPASMLKLPPPTPSDVVRIGYPAGLTHDKDIGIVNLAASQLSRIHDDIEWVFFGEDYRKNLKAYPARFVKWQQNVPKYHASLDFDIGIAPLKKHPFNLSKSPIKAMEYAARGIPIVASNVGPYADYVEHGVTGFLADRDGEWLDYLQLLITDADLRASMGAAARRKVEPLTYESNAWRWEEVLSSL